MKEFVTAVIEADQQDKAEGDRGYPFKQDGVEYLAHKPTEAQYAVFVANTGRHMATSDKIAGLIDLFFELLDEESHQALYRRLMDRNDPFGVDQIENILKWLIEVWSGKASDEPSDSTGSSPSTSDSSPEATPALT